MRFAVTALFALLCATALPSEAKAHDPYAEALPSGDAFEQRYRRVRTGAHAAAALCIPAGIGVGYGYLGLASGGDLGVAIGRLAAASTAGALLLCGSALHANVGKADDLVSGALNLSPAPRRTRWALLVGSAASFGLATALNPWESGVGLSIGAHTLGTALGVASIWVGLDNLKSAHHAYLGARARPPVTFAPHFDGRVIGVGGRL